MDSPLRDKIIAQYKAALLSYSRHGNYIRESPLAYVVIFLFSAHLLSMNAFLLSEHSGDSTSLMMQAWFKILKASLFNSTSGQMRYSVYPIATMSGMIITFTFFFFWLTMRKSGAEMLCNATKAWLVIVGVAVFIPGVVFMINTRDRLIVVNQDYYAPKFDKGSTAFQAIYLITWLIFVSHVQFGHLLTLSFRNFLKDKHCLNSHWYFPLLYAMTLGLIFLDWSVREHQLPPILVDLTSCLIATYQVITNLYYKSFIHPGAHLFHGCLSAFYLGHSVQLLLIHQLSEEHRTYLEASYFLVAGLLVKLYYNWHRKLFSYSSEFLESLPKNFTDRAEINTLFKILGGDQSGKSNFRVFEYLQKHFAECNISSCMCEKLRKNMGTGQSKFDIGGLHLNNLIDEFLADRLEKLYRKHPKNVFIVIALVNCLVFRFNKPVKACMAITRLQMKPNNKQLPKTIYQVLFQWVNDSLSNEMDDNESKLHAISFHHSILFGKGLKQVTSGRIKLMEDYTRFYSYILDNNIAHLSKIRANGMAYVKQARALEKQLARLLDLNPHSPELILVMLDLKNMLHEESKETITSLELKLHNIYQRKLTEKNALNRYQSRPEISKFDEDTVFLMVDVFGEDFGKIVSYTKNFLTTFEFPEHVSKFSSVYLKDILPSSLVQPHQRALQKFSASGDQFFTTHNYNELLLAQTKANFLTPVHVCVKLEAVDYNIYAAAAIIPYETKSSYILLDMNKNIVSYTGALQEHLGGLEGRLERSRYNICMLMPSLYSAFTLCEREIESKSPSRSGEGGTVAGRSSRNKTRFAATLYAVWSHNSSSSRDSKLFELSRKFAENIGTIDCSEVFLQEAKSLFRTIPNFDTTNIYKLNCNINYHGHHQSDLNYWSIEITDFKLQKTDYTASKKLALLFDAKGVSYKANSNVAGTYKDNEVHTLLSLSKKNSMRAKFVDKDTSNAKDVQSLKPTQCDSEVGRKNYQSAATFYPAIKEQSLDSLVMIDENSNIEFLNHNISNKSRKSGQSQVLDDKDALIFHFPHIKNQEQDTTIKQAYTRQKNRKMDSEVLQSIDAERGSFDLGDSANFDSNTQGQAHFKLRQRKKKKTEFLEKRAAQLSEAGTKYTAASSVSIVSSNQNIRNSIKSHNASKMLRGYNIFGLAATLTVLMMLLLQFYVSQTSLVQLENLANMNLAPSQVATYMNMGVRKLYQRLLLYKGSLSIGLIRTNGVLINAYFGVVESNFPSLLNDTSDEGVVSEFMNTNLVEIRQPDTPSVSELASPYTALTQAINAYNSAKAALIDPALYSNPSFEPRVFLEINYKKIEQMLVAFMKNIFEKVQEHISFTTNLNTAVLFASCLITFLVLASYYMVYHLINKKEAEFLILFCKISRNDIREEAERYRFREDHKEKSALKNKQNGTSDRFFTSYRKPDLKYALSAVMLVFSFAILTIPFIISYLQFRSNMSYWGLGTLQRNEWEKTRIQLMGLGTDITIHYAYAASDAKKYDSYSDEIDKSRALVNERLQQVGSFFSRFGVLENQNIYTGNLSEAIIISGSSDFCQLTQQSEFLQALCRSILGGVSENGAMNAIALLLEKMDEQTDQLARATDKAAALREIGNSALYSETEYMLGFINIVFRLIAISLHENLIALLGEYAEALTTLFVMTMTIYLSLMLVAWAIFIRKMSRKLVDTKQILNLLPVHLIKGNPFVRNFLCKTFKIDIRR